MGVVVPHNEFQAEAFLTDVLGAKNVHEHGDELIHSCILPFGLHKNGDAIPSASFNREKLVYNCFKCGGGNLLWVTQEVLGISSSEARRIIEQNFKSSAQSPRQFLEELEKRWKGLTGEAPVMPSYSMVMLEPWLCHARYLDERGVSRDVQDTMKTGINLENIDAIGDSWVTQPRLVIPHIFEDKLRGWSARKIDNRQAGPKYKHTPNFPKNFTLYNWDRVREKDTIVVVESPLSVLRMMSEGVDNAVAVFGAQTTDNQVALLKQFKKVIIFPDGDAAGYSSLVEPQRHKKPGLITRLYKSTDLWIVDHGIINEDGYLRYNNKDAADYNAEQLHELIDKATPAYMWNWRYEDVVQKVHDGKAGQKEEVRTSP